MSNRASFIAIIGVLWPFPLSQFFFPLLLFESLLHLIAAPARHGA